MSNLKHLAAKTKARWMRRYELAMLERLPELAGKLDLNQATYFFNEGLAPVEAAATAVANQPNFIGGIKPCT